MTIAPSGAKTFFLSYTSPEDGKRKQVALGRFPQIGLRDARLRASELRNQVDQGKDPAFEKRAGIAARIAKRQLGTLGDLMDVYASHLELDGKRAAKEVRRITLKDIPAAFLSRPAHLVTRDDILDILAPIIRRGALAHSDNVRAYLRAAFQFGIQLPSMARWRGNVRDFQVAFDPVSMVRKTVTRRSVGMRVLNEEQVRGLWYATTLTPQMHLALKLILCTGQRVEEVIHARWSEFDSDISLWTIPGERRKTRNKSVEPHIVPLTSFHRELIEQVKRLSCETPFLFPARRNTEPLRHNSLYHAVLKFVQDSNMATFSPRDLRRTFKTLGGSFGISLEMRNRLQGHAMTDVGSVHYDRYDYLTQKREAMESYANRLSAILCGPHNAT